MWFFRLPPIAYFILAPLAAAFGVFMYFDMSGNDAARAKALSHAAPAEIAIETFDAAKNVSDADEVTILAQLDLATMYEVVRTKRGSERGRTTLGMLYPTDAKATTEKASGMMVVDGAVDDGQLSKIIVAEGAIGPIVRLNGTIGAESGKDSETNMASEKTAGLVPNAIYIEPFLNGRATDLKPSGGGGDMLGFSLLAAALIGGYGWFRLRRQRKSEQDLAEQQGEVTEAPAA